MPIYLQIMPSIKDLPAHPPCACCLLHGVSLPCSQMGLLEELEEVSWPKPLSLWRQVCEYVFGFYSPLICSASKGEFLLFFSYVKGSFL